ncbi:sulfate permease [Chitinibacter bivalviorum]|uniref:Sulfate permease n=1 Tax=Chitinibacter bivalviorum TaxID=2739434 RepID=A0A7H9BH18_9NEIS|nr:sulfate permease [Chitinibacter bivalviorum]QLG87839.1 sulfate permease [Chitinibacter bivalviorum]
MSIRSRFRPTSLLPQWMRQYHGGLFAGDFSASVIVALLLIPQGLAYAQLAGLPPMAGLYASLGPLLVYGFFGSSMTQSVGPMAITSAMTASALAPLALAGSREYLALAATLTLLSGLMLTLFGKLKLGQMTRLLSLPVVQGFSAGTALLIALGQTGALLGAQWRGDTLIALAQHVPAAVQQLSAAPLLFGLFGLLAMWLSASPAAGLLQKLGLAQNTAQLAGKVLPLLTMMVLAIALIWLDPAHQIKTLGKLPDAHFAIEHFNLDLVQMQSLVLPALLIGLAGYLQSITVAQTIAASRHQTIDANRELVALGNCNVASAFLGGLPVSGGFSRTVVNTSAGAQTPLAGMMSAVWMLLALWLLLPALAFLPQALLAATIILATSRMISFEQLRKAWQFDRRDGLAWIVTFTGVLLTGPMLGIALGVGIAILLYVWRSHKPHIAVVGQVPHTEHYRNVERFQTQTVPTILAIRVDENLYFANTANVIEQIKHQLNIHAASGQIKHLLLILSAVNSIDYSAINDLKEWHKALADAGITLHLAEVKGPVLETLMHGDLLEHLDRAPFISTHAAFTALSPRQQEDYTI